MKIFDKNVFITALLLMFELKKNKVIYPLKSK